MKSREDIMASVEVRTVNEHNQELILEVLLDIRDALHKGGKNV